MFGTSEGIQPMYINIGYSNLQNVTLRDMT